MDTMMQEQELVVRTTVLTEANCTIEVFSNSVQLSSAKLESKTVSLPPEQNVVTEVKVQRHYVETEPMAISVLHVPPDKRHVSVLEIKASGAKPTVDSVTSKIESERKVSDIVDTTEERYGEINTSSVETLIDMETNEVVTIKKEVLVSVLEIKASETKPTLDSVPSKKENESDRTVSDKVDITKTKDVKNNTSSVENTVLQIDQVNITEEKDGENNTSFVECKMLKTESVNITEEQDGEHNTSSVESDVSETESRKITEKKDGQNITSSIESEMLGTDFSEKLVEGETDKVVTIKKKILVSTDVSVLKVKASDTKQIVDSFSSKKESEFSPVPDSVNVSKDKDSECITSSVENKVLETESINITKDDEELKTSYVESKALQTDRVDITDEKCSENKSSSVANKVLETEKLDDTEKKDGETNEVETFEKEVLISSDVKTAYMSTETKVTFVKETFTQVSQSMVETSVSLHNKSVESSFNESTDRQSEIVQQSDHENDGTEKAGDDRSSTSSEDIGMQVVTGFSADNKDLPCNTNNQDSDLLMTDSETDKERNEASENVTSMEIKAASRKVKTDGKNVKIYEETKQLELKQPEMKPDDFEQTLVDETRYRIEDQGTNVDLAHEKRINEQFQKLLELDPLQEEKQTSGQEGFKSDTYVLGSERSVELLLKQEQVHERSVKMKQIDLEKQTAEIASFPTKRQQEDTRTELGKERIEEENHTTSETSQLIEANYTINSFKPVEWHEESRIDAISQIEEEHVENQQDKITDIRHFETENIGEKQIHYNPEERHNEFEIKSPLPAAKEKVNDELQTSPDINEITVEKQVINVQVSSPIQEENNLEESKNSSNTKQYKLEKAKLEQPSLKFKDGKGTPKTKNKRHTDLEERRDDKVEKTFGKITDKMTESRGNTEHEQIQVEKKSIDIITKSKNVNDKNASSEPVEEKVGIEGIERSPQSIPSSFDSLDLSDSSLNLSDSCPSPENIEEEYQADDLKAPGKETKDFTLEPDDERYVLKQTSEISMETFTEVHVEENNNELRQIEERDYVNLDNSESSDGSYGVVNVDVCTQEMEIREKSESDYVNLDNTPTSYSFKVTEITHEVIYDNQEAVTDVETYEEQGKDMDKIDVSVDMLPEHMRSDIDYGFDGGKEGRKDYELREKLMTEQAVEYDVKANIRKFDMPDLINDTKWNDKGKVSQEHSIAFIGHEKESGDVTRMKEIFEKESYGNSEKDRREQIVSVEIHTNSCTTEENVQTTLKSVQTDVIVSDRIEPTENHVNETNLIAEENKHITESLIKPENMEVEMDYTKVEIVNGQTEKADLWLKEENSNKEIESRVVKLEQVDIVTKLDNESNIDIHAEQETQKDQHWLIKQTKLTHTEVNINNNKTESNEFAISEKTDNSGYKIGTDGNINQNANDVSKLQVEMRHKNTDSEKKQSVKRKLNLSGGSSVAGSRDTLKLNSGYFGQNILDSDCGLTLLQSMIR